MREGLGQMISVAGIWMIKENFKGDMDIYT